jgi:hypothetical protein
MQQDRVPVTEQVIQASRISSFFLMTNPPHALTSPQCKPCAGSWYWPVAESREMSVTQPALLPEDASFCAKPPTMNQTRTLAVDD